jgi:hypothetical protein
MNTVRILKTSESCKSYLAYPMKRLDLIFIVFSMPKHRSSLLNKNAVPVVAILQGKTNLQLAYNWRLWVLPNDSDENCRQKLGPVPTTCYRYLPQISSQWTQFDEVDCFAFRFLPAKSPRSPVTHELPERGFRRLASCKRTHPRSRSRPRRRSGGSLRGRRRLRRAGLRWGRGTGPASAVAARGGPVDISKPGRQKNVEICQSMKG